MRLKNLIITFFVVVFVVIVIGWGSCALIVGTIVSHPEETGQAVGDFGKKLHDGYREAIKPE